MPKLTVMMSAFRAHETLGRSITSTLRAMPRDAELVVAVDGPDEPTMAVATSITDPRLRVVNDDMNIGTARRHQQILELTDSELVANIDADDITFPWRFRATLPALADADFVFGSAIRFGDRRPRSSYPIGLNDQELRFALMFFVPLFHSSMAARREALDQVGGYRQIGYAEDWELWMRAAASPARLRKLALPVIGYRLSPTQMSQNASKYQKERDNEFWLESHRALLERNGLPGLRSAEGQGKVHLTRVEYEKLLGGCRKHTRPYLRSHTVQGVEFVEGGRA